jgi:plasmid stabilization system protein ParE
MKIRYKRAALLDIQQKYDYIANVLKNKKAAQTLVERILHAVSQLTDNPMIGASLNSKFDVNSDLRFLIVAKQLVFYRIEDMDFISIVRVLDGRQDYISVLFG